MKETEPVGRVHLCGDVVEVISRDGKQWARIQLRPPIIEVEAEILKDAHLGDTVAINAALTIQQVNPLHEDL